MWIADFVMIFPKYETFKLACYKACDLVAYNQNHELGLEVHEILFL